MSKQAVPIDADELKRLRESHAELLATASAMSLAWANKPPLAWQPDGLPLLLTTLRVAIAKAT